jgi:hypothetical protein
MKFVSVLAAMTAVLAIGAPAVAHHSVYGAFDQNRVTPVKGVVKKVDWINPHIFFTIDQTLPNGQVKTWRVETHPPAFMRRVGVTKEMLQGGGKPMDMIFLPARKEGVDNVAYLARMTTSDGKTIVFTPDR